MQLFVNDLSLHQQFPTPAAFRQRLHELLRCRDCARTFNRPFYVSRAISNRMVTTDQTFRQVITHLGDTNLTRLVMAWIDRQGPFADDVLTRNDDEYYWHRHEDDIVTEEMLGEVAARYFAGQQAALVSFAPSDYAQSPLTVTWHQAAGSSAVCDLDNFWESPPLHTFLEQLQEAVQSWDEMLERARARFTNLTFLDNLEKHLVGESFNLTIARRSLELLDVLNRLKGSYTPTGERTEEGNLLIENYFWREQAILTDASETEKNDPKFRREMTFTDPEGRLIECFWHGKIRHRSFRIHFSSIEPDKPLYVAYIGPKLTKQ